MHHRLVRCACFWLTILAATASAQSISTAESAPPADPSAWLEALRNLPAVLRLTLPIPTSAPPVCRVSALPAIQDPDAVAFEGRSEDSGVIDLDGLKPAMARALERFRKMVLSAGGTFDLKSAYRPMAYQAHLQEVWYKWRELRNNREAGCQLLRAEVAGEFTRHRLMETQMPVTSSDHTRGLAFDAAVVLPRTVRRRRVSLDRLAVLAGLRRPDILRDPVHFKLVIARGGLHG